MVSFFFFLRSVLPSVPCSICSADFFFFSFAVLLVDRRNTYRAWYDGLELIWWKKDIPL